MIGQFEGFIDQNQTAIIKQSEQEINAYMPPEDNRTSEKVG